MKVIFHVRCDGEPDDDLEERLIAAISAIVEIPENWNILTVGRSYYHNRGDCPGHPEPNDMYSSCPERGQARDPDAGVDLVKRGDKWFRCR
jgi:hypothetical protein